NQTIQRHSQSCKDMPMSNGGLNLIHQWPIPRRSENGSRTILKVRRFLIQKRPRFLIREPKSKQPWQAHNQKNQLKENSNRSFIYFRNTKKSRLMKKVKRVVQMKMTVSESTLMMIEDRNSYNLSKSITGTIQNRNCSYSLGHLYLYCRNSEIFNYKRSPRPCCEAPFSFTHYNHKK
ncbi:hypothetical protein PIB30_067452, partial [Stylosanthes scabra]|nr:hypothetical protein [Stylosanthes scabra]